MAQYLSKDTLVAEIERRKKYYENIQTIKPVYESNIEDFNELLSFLDTLEVKEIGVAIPYGIDDILEEEGIDPNSKTAKIIKESYYIALEKFKARKEE